ncbi:MAG: molybdenum cofactor biosynthesis protein MoaE [Gemmatimonadaceae bacterium]|nr:molybdenum cofactor biosynthesis protein MoaE [Gemmatimonadaceae bacterium]NUO94120.1 molybdenum cofactor biosynthesis protein MoaE [Gemmatimonadaceae bacterium]NUP55623.1 molybdenum cofactor biosynthesis protein MoaE [Gemmatimonadaceae bacterium]NUP72849.1 molybdenum cofactor biosynthesis protein MoaE [Gemmatimonadaceae bacterium]NUR35683.1 molybdenum cofactor biosynthesis protein MoaE [Gemmatimonadaceae bacterium]
MTPVARLTRDPIDPTALLASVARPRHGAILLFLGVVREVNDGRPVTGIEYSAYEAMALRELAAIADETLARFDATDVAIEHRLGELALEEASVGIAVAHAHRGVAYDASRWVIEELKRRVPIWKREQYVDGTREWVDPTGRPTEAAVGGERR